MKKRTRKEETCGAAVIAGHLLVSLQSLGTSLKKRWQQPTCGPVLDNVSLCSQWYNRVKYSNFKIISANTGGTGLVTTAQSCSLRDSRLSVCLEKVFL